MYNAVAHRSSDFMSKSDICYFLPMYIALQGRNRDITDICIYMCVCVNLKSWYLIMC